MSNRLIKKVSKVARNTLQEDLIRTLDLICEYAKNDIQKYKKLLFIAFLMSNKSLIMKGLWN